MAERPPLEITDPSGSGGPYANGIYDFRVAKGEDGGYAVRVDTVGVEGFDQAEPFSINLLPFDGGNGPGKWGNPRTTSNATEGMDTSRDDGIYPPPRLNSLTFTSAVQQGSMAIQYGSGPDIYVLNGRYVHKIDSARSVSTERDLGAAVIGTWITVIANEIFVCCGQSGFIQKRTAAGAWSTSADVRAFCMAVVGALVWRVGGAAAGIDNAISSISALGATVATTAMTVANYNTAAGYYVGDASYQAHSIADYGGVPAVGRPDGVFVPDPATKFKNQTPQVAQSPEADNCRSLRLSGGYLFTFTNKGMIRMEPGKAIRIGPETLGIPGSMYRIYDLVEWDRSTYLVGQTTAVISGANQYTVLFKMVRDRKGVGSGEYLFHLWAAISNAGTAAALGKWVASQSTTQPAILFGGGTAVTSGNYFILGRGAGQDTDDPNYQFATTSAIRTGPFYPDPTSKRKAILHGCEVGLFPVSDVGNSLSYVVDSIADPVTFGGTSMLTSQEGGGSANMTAAGRHVRYAAQGAQGTFFDIRLALATTGAAGSRTVARFWRAFGELLPILTDEVTIDVVASPRSSLTAWGRADGMDGPRALSQFRLWAKNGTLLKCRIAGYEDDEATERNTRFIVQKVGAVVSETEQGPNATIEQEWRIRVTLRRMDYEGAYAT